jgi:hypothetical protein
MGIGFNDTAGPSPSAAIAGVANAMPTSSVKTDDKK